jgi:hypothetical protein
MGASGWFYYKEIYYDARSHERKKPHETVSRDTHIEGMYGKTCLKRNAIVPVLFSVFTGFRFTKGCVLIKQSTKNMIA